MTPKVNKRVNKTFKYLSSYSQSLAKEKVLLDFTQHSTSSNSVNCPGKAGYIDSQCT